MEVRKYPPLLQEAGGRRHQTDPREVRPVSALGKEKADIWDLLARLAQAGLGLCSEQGPTEGVCYISL